MRPARPQRELNAPEKPGDLEARVRELEEIVAELVRAHAAAETPPSAPMAMTRERAAALTAAMHGRPAKPFRRRHDVTVAGGRESLAVRVMFMLPGD
jgi:NaMN:DMB phosphoribosyltransferase